MTALDERRNQSKWVGIFDPTLYIPILDSLSLHLTVADVLILCQVCKGFGSLKVYMLKKVSNINDRLKDFVNNPALLRSKLGQYGALISGIFARSLFDLKPRRALCLDVFISDGADAEHLAEHLEDYEGYNMETEIVRVANANIQDYFAVLLTTTHPAIQTSKQVTYTSSGRIGFKLRVTRTSGAPIHHILTSSYTTACVNVVTWNNAYSMFPLETLVKHRFYPLKSFDDGFGSRLKELAHQGWTTRDIIWPDLENGGCSKVTRLRRVGDSSSLIIPLNTKAVIPPSIPDFVIEYAQFEVLKDDLLRPRRGPFGEPLNYTSPRGSFLRLHTKEMISPSVRHVYTTGSNSWSMYVTERLRRWAWLELFKMGIEGSHWLNSTTFPLNSEVSNFGKPEAWDYADDQIPKWYLEWERQARQ